MSLTISDLIRLVNSAQKAASQHRAGRVRTRLNRHSRKTTIANLRALKNFAAHHNPRVQIGRKIANQKNQWS